jgi:tetratricopeptide (TPR) repeat protein
MMFKEPDDIKPTSSENLIRDGFALNPDADTNRLEELALRYFDKGAYQQAIPLLEFGAHRYRETGNQSKLAQHLRSIGWCYHMLGRNSEAERYYKESFNLLKRLGNHEPLFSYCSDEYATVLRSLHKDAEGAQVEHDGNVKPSG